MTINRRDVLAGGLGLASFSALGTQLVAQTIAPKIPKEAIILIAELKALPGQEEAVKNALIAMVAPTRKENGCLCYNLHQSKKDPGTFVFYEQWANQSALDVHGKSAHMRAMRSATKGKLAKGGATQYQLLA